MRLAKRKRALDEFEVFGNAAPSSGEGRPAKRSRDTGLVVDHCEYMLYV
jgi:hypothetical protein